MLAPLLVNAAMAVSPLALECSNVTSANPLPPLQKTARFVSVRLVTILRAKPRCALSVLLVLIVTALASQRRPLAFLAVGGVQQTTR